MHPFDSTKYGRAMAMLRGALGEHSGAAAFREQLVRSVRHAQWAVDRWTARDPPALELPSGESSCGAACSSGLAPVVVTPAREPSPREQASTQLASYLACVGYSCRASMVMELPLCILPGCAVRWRALRPMLLQTRGTMLAAQLALRTGFGVVLGGGFHHASAEGGHGFCAFNDLTMAARVSLGAFG